MRVRRLALAAALPLALALAACSGGAAAPETASPPAPTAAATPEATSTPAPTALAAPAATPPPDAASALPPEQACANGVAVAEPEANPGLVADCEALLRAKDALRGEASLDWGGGLAVADWEGVTVFGEPPRVRRLDLRGKGLTGSIPRELRRLRLGQVRLAGNALTGCVPSAFEDASTHDIASLGLPWCLRYDRLDATGEVAEAGSWAILGGNGEVLTTWEQLRSEAATLRVHQTDAGGTSWATEFGAVAVNDLFEWRLADDCWVRYRVAGNPVAPSGASGRWEFPVEWMTYAATGAGCTGAVGSSTVLRVDEAAPVIQSPDIAEPIRHGPWLLHPFGWTGDLEEQLEYPIPGSSSVSGAEGSPLPEIRTLDDWPEPRVTTDITVARQFPLWRDPALPEGWRLYDAETGTASAPYPDGYVASFADDEGWGGVEIYLYHRTIRPYHLSAWRGERIRETRIIDGHPALVEYAPDNQLFNTRVSIFNRTTGLVYVVEGLHSSLRGRHIDRTIEIARSLYRTPP